MKKFIKIFVSLVLLGILIYWIDLGQVKDSIKNANYFYLFIAFLIVSFSRVLMAVKWDILLRAKNIIIPIDRVIGIYYISTFLGLFLPPTVGGDAVRTYYAAKRKEELPDVLASIVVERVIGFITLFLAGIIGFVIFTFLISKDEIDTLRVLLIFTFLFVVGFAGFYFSFKDWFRNLIFKFGEKTKNIKYISKISGVLTKFIDSYQGYKNHKGAMLSFTWLTFMEIFCVIVWAYFVALGLNVHVTFYYFMAFIPVVLVSIRLPISVAGFGVNEGLYVYFLTLVGVDAGVAFSVGLVDHIIILLAIMPGGIFYLLYPKEKQVEEVVHHSGKSLANAENLK